MKNLPNHFSRIPPCFATSSPHHHHFVFGWPKVITRWMEYRHYFALPAFSPVGNGAGLDSSLYIFL